MGLAYRLKSKREPLEVKGIFYILMCIVLTQVYTYAIIYHATGFGVCVLSS
jgi:hypothetical protein